MTHEIKLSREKRGSEWFDVAECLGHVVRKSKHSVISPLCRKLIEDGALAREEMVIVTRDGETVFTEATAAHWADKMTYESSKAGLHAVKWDYEAAAKRQAYFQDAEQ